jgi:hypothetical protein
MSAPRFTKGPWRVDPLNWGDVQDAEGALEIASTSDTVLIGGEKPERDEQKANAHLIAAAPELYELLVCCNDYLSNIPRESEGGDDYARELMRDVLSGLAKARGETT